MKSKILVFVFLILITIVFISGCVEKPVIYNETEQQNKIPLLL